MFHLFFQATKQLLQRNQRSPQTQTYDLDKEIQLYLHEPAQTLESDLLLYWKEETRFPKLKKLAARYLAIPAGSVFSEQIFSEAGNIEKPTKTSLTSENVQNLIFLKKKITC